MQGLSDELIDSVMELADNFYEPEEIAEKLNIPIDTVLQAIGLAEMDSINYNEDDWREDR
jgi:orotate phosphoribosyltransferase-like protein